ncbi:ArsR family transcriptional regulator [uncultured Draconibacterium sp.]|uniref:ArsR family transcriptional regulator n=1 Tax=uncultured Draconibacterium sp. TaxID=1573823 RepID=UPI0032603EC8
MLKFFLNKETTSYLRNLENEFGESSNAIRVELNRLEAANLLSSSFRGNKKYFQANDEHPLYQEINSILKKTVGLDKIIEKVTSNIGNLQKAYVTGDLAKGKDSSVIDLLLVGDSIDSSYVAALTSKAEKLIHRRIRFLCIQEQERDEYLKNSPALLLWKNI